MSLLLGWTYAAGFSFLGLFGFRMLGLAIGAWCCRHRQPEPMAGLGGLGAESSDGRPPRVTVQLPIYNERYVAARAIDALCRLRWPADRLEIQVLDDSEDETRAIVDARARAWRERGVDIRVIRRGHREGFKAGALAAGFERSQGEALAVFDADFVPPPDFLERALPYLGPGIGAVQARWGHLNAGDSLLTRAQALALDGHFLVEQTAQSRLGLMLNFNGTAGVWRRQAIEAAGGWQGDTLTEDFDLSYRAQMAGWSIRMLPDLVAPAELPASLPAYRRQQHRWAKGTVQVLRKLGRQLLAADMPLHRRLLGLLTLSGYLVHPVMLALLLGAPLLLVWPPSFPPALSLLTLAPFCPPLLYACALALEGGESRGWRLLRDYPALALLTVGMAWTGSRAVVGALVGRGGRFERTPKRGDGAAMPMDEPGIQDGQGDPHALAANSDYRLHLGWQSWLELTLAAYAWLLVWAAISRGVFWLAIFGGLYGLGFGIVVWFALRGNGSHRAEWPIQVTPAAGRAEARWSDRG